ncbi:hypothetical protein K2X30_07545 [bacterium]|nr:hypothetical protein [bacterium]
MATTRSQLSVVFLALLLGSNSCTRDSRKDQHSAPAAADVGITLYTPIPITTLDPAQVDDLPSTEQLGNAYEGLLQYHYLKRPYTLAPNLAEALPQISADGKTITFKIKKGVLFHDDPCFKETEGRGRELVANDFVFSIRRSADPKLRSHSWTYLDQMVVGLNEWREESEKSGNSDYSKPIEGLKALDRYTLQIKLTKTSPRFIYLFAMPFSFAVPHEALSYYSGDLGRHAVGTGPYRLAEADWSSRWVWTKNPSYREEYFPEEGETEDKTDGHLADAKKILPLAPKLTYRLIADENQRWSDFMEGKIDISPVPGAKLESVLAPNKDLDSKWKSKGYALSKTSTLEITHLTFNLADPLLGSNKALRQALSMVVDQPSFNHLFYADRVIVAFGPIPPGLLGYDAGLKNPYRVFSVGRAKELLVKAGFPDGKGIPELEFLTTSDPKGQQIAEFYSRSFETIGVKIKIKSLSPRSLAAEIQEGKAKLWLESWRADFPDPENFMQLFYSKKFPPGPNDSRYSNPTFDQLYETAFPLADAKMRGSFYRRMVEIVLEDCPWVFGVHKIADNLVQPWLKNFKFHDFDFGKAKYYRIDPAKRQLPKKDEK